MGNSFCSSRDDFDQKHLVPLPKLERDLFEDEQEFQLTKVPFSKYRVVLQNTAENQEELTQDQLQKVAQEIKLDTSQIQDHPWSADAVILQDKNFTYDEKKNVYYKEPLMAIGFLHCTFENAPEHEFDMWKVMNSKDDIIDLNQLMAFIDKLFYVSIDQRLSFENLRPEQQTDKIKLLEKCKEGKSAAMERIKSKFNEDEVEKKSFQKYIGNNMLRTYQIRGLALGRIIQDEPANQSQDGNKVDLDAVSSSSRKSRRKNNNSNTKTTRDIDFDNKDPVMSGYTLGNMRLPNRIVCAALTRCRANPSDGIPNDLHAEYYSARASSAFMFTECVPITLQGNSLPGCCGLYTDEQEEGWKKVVKAVHDKGGRIVLQMWHGGRTCIPDQINGQEVLSASDIPLPNEGRRKEGKPVIIPKACTQQDIDQLKQDYQTCAQRAKRIGFDAIQLHCGYGYLMDTFLRDGTNNRTDQYGGSISNRTKLPLEILDLLIQIYGNEKVGVKLTLRNDHNDMQDSNPEALCSVFIQGLNERQVGFLEMAEGPSQRMDNDINTIQNPFNAKFKKSFKGTWISGFGYTKETANDHIKKGQTDLVAFGWLYVANADLVEKFASGETLNSCKNITDMSQFAQLVYYGGPLGYTDLSVYAPPEQQKQTAQPKDDPSNALEETPNPQKFDLFSPCTIGDLQLPNRIVCCALTRCRANPADGIPTDLHAEYYSSRSTSAFMFTECVPISLEGNGLPGCCGIYTDEQEQGWQKVVKAVHNNGGRIILQLWHGGRTCIPEQIGGLTPISSSAIPLPNEGRRKEGKPVVVPKAATQQDLDRIKAEFKKAAVRAKNVGFDGIEVHCGYGYLLDSFLRDGTNQRKDQYGGSLQNRVKYPLEVLDAIIEVFGSQRVGVKVSPRNDFNDMSDSDPSGLLDYFISRLNEKKIGFLELTEGPSIGKSLKLQLSQIGMENDINKIEKPYCSDFKKKFNGKWIANWGFTKETGTKFIQNGLADLISFGWMYVSNPDLVEKFQNNSELNSCQNIEDKSKIPSLVYYGGPLGYTDLSVYLSPAQQNKLRQESQLAEQQKKQPEEQPGDQQNKQKQEEPLNSQRSNQADKEDFKNHMGGWTVSLIEEQKKILEERRKSLGAGLQNNAEYEKKIKDQTFQLASKHSLFSTYILGDLILPNRIVCASLSRCRADPATGIPTDLHVEYYAARANAAFIITESASVSIEGNGLPGSCGMYTDQQEIGWKKVVDAVHQKGGRIFMQLWHGGRTCFPEMIGGMQPISVTIAPLPNVDKNVAPKFATQEDINRIKNEFKEAAQRAKRAGFDGIEINCGFGYLLDSFLRDGINTRKDKYGASIENRARFPLEVLEAIFQVYPRSKVGIKFSPRNDQNGQSDSNPNKLVEYLISKLNQMNVGFLEMCEGPTSGIDHDITKIEDLFCQNYKKHFKGMWISNFGYTQKIGQEHIKRGYTDLISYGWLYVSNPDLVNKFESGDPLNSHLNIKDQEQFNSLVYFGGPEGYTDVSVFDKIEQPIVEMITDDEKEDFEKSVGEQSIAGQSIGGQSIGGGIDRQQTIAGQSIGGGVHRQQTIAGQSIGGGVDRQQTSQSIDKQQSIPGQSIGGGLQVTPNEKRNFLLDSMTKSFQGKLSRNYQEDQPLRKSVTTETQTEQDLYMDNQNDKKQDSPKDDNPFNKQDSYIIQTDDSINSVVFQKEVQLSSKRVSVTNRNSAYMNNLEEIENSEAKMKRRKPQIEEDKASQLGRSRSSQNNIEQNTLQSKKLMFTSQTRQEDKESKVFQVEDERRIHMEQDPKSLGTLVIEEKLRQTHQKVIVSPNIRRQTAPPEDKLAMIMKEQSDIKRQRSSEHGAYNVEGLKANKKVTIISNKGFKDISQ